MILQNFYATIHAGAVAAVAEAVSIACARTVFPEEKEIFLGEMSISYLSGAPKNVCLILSGPLTFFFKGNMFSDLIKRIENAKQSTSLLIFNAFKI